MWWTLVPAKFPDSALPSMDLPPRVIPVLDFEPGPAPQEHRAATLQSTRMQCASSFPSASQALPLGWYVRSSFLSGSLCEISLKILSRTTIIVISGTIMSLRGRWASLRILLFTRHHRGEELPASSVLIQLNRLAQLDDFSTSLT